MTDIASATYWAIVSPPNYRSKRRYIDYSSLSYTRKGAIAKHCDHTYLTAAAFWAMQRKKGWTAERVQVSSVSEQSQ